MNNHLHQSSAFTFIELLVVIAIIGVLAAVVVANTLRAKIRVRDTKRIDDITNIAKALQMYSTQNFSYPKIADDQGSCLGIGEEIDGFIKGFLGRVPKDPRQSIVLERPSGKCGQLPADNNEYYYYYSQNHRCSGRPFAEIHIERLETLSYSSNQPHNLCPSNPTDDYGQFLDADYAIILDEVTN